MMSFRNFASSSKEESRRSRGDFPLLLSTGTSFAQFHPRRTFMENPPRSSNAMSQYWRGGMRAPALLLALVFFSPSPAYAQNGNPTSIKIDNFGKVNDRLYRGSQPKKHDYARLAEAGIRTVLDLRLHPEKYARTEAEMAGLRYISLPIHVRKYPAPDMAARFLALVTDAANWPIYAHCEGGRHRTGAMIAVYRIEIEGWVAEQAYREMKQYGFYTRWWHKRLKKYVFDYFRLMKGRNAPIALRKVPHIDV
jgi:protein tyrosine phosphatase (PTP) superfamily phosphohydrolase (DUF442 family)